jgi:RNA polymerase sigma factor (sigma-70 family)
MPPTDLELLSHFAHDKHDLAFTNLVARHRAWIFAACRRRLGDDHLADDATQAVFLILAEKAPALAHAETCPLSAWLFRVLHFTVSRIKRTRDRQQRIEQTALQPRGEAPLPTELLALLEDTIAQLTPIDREAIIRRFYQRQDFAAVGSALNITAEAARKRITRCLQSVKNSMLNDGIDVIPDHLLPTFQTLPPGAPRIAHTSDDEKRIDSLAKGTVAMIEQIEAIEFAVMSAEFFVTDVDENLNFFEKLGFRRRFVEPPDATGHTPRASLAAGAARIWLRSANPARGTNPAPGMTLFFWMDGGEQILTKHRANVAAQSLPVSQLFYDITLINFTTTTPDGYTIGFFSTKNSG